MATGINIGSSVVGPLVVVEQHAGLRRLLEGAVTAGEEVHGLLQTSGAVETLLSLLQATESGGQAGGMEWEYALRVDRLLKGGLSPTLLRLLIGGGCLQQRVETTGPKSRRRSFREVHNLSLADGCSVLLTVEGIALVRSVLEGARAGGKAEDAVIGVQAVRPHWSAAGGVLWLVRQVVRRVATQARALRVVLDSLEEEHWPVEGIDNPLPSTRTVSDVQRLREVIEELNANQCEARIVFSRDRSKTRVLWRIP